MMKIIWKYELSIMDVQTMMLPDEAVVLHVHEQDRRLFVWVMFDSNRPSTKAHVFYIVGTGNGFSHWDMPGCEYVGTAHVDGFVWHVFHRIA